MTKALRAHRVQQHEARLGAGARWVDDERNLVFRTTIGMPLDGITVTRRLQYPLRGRACVTSISTTCGTPVPR